MSIEISRTTKIEIDGVEGIVEDIVLIHSISEMLVEVFIWQRDEPPGKTHRVIHGHHLQTKLVTGSAKIL